MLPQFIIIGGQKCGTTYLHHVLRQHPDIYLPKQEVPFFRKPDYNPHQISSYFNKLHKDDGRIFGIKRPDYLGRVGVEKRIAKHIPNVKLIVILRNPLDRLRSHYFHSLKTGFLPVNKLNDGVEQLLNGRLEKKHPYSKRIIDYVFYYKHLQRYFHLFSKRNIKVLLFVDLKEHPQKTADKLLRFIGVDNKCKLNYSIRPQKGIYSIARLLFRKKFLPILYTYNEERTRLEVNKGLTGITGKAYTAFDILVLSKLFRQKPPKFNYEIKERLINIYEKDILQLQKLINKDLSHWLNLDR